MKAILIILPMFFCLQFTAQTGIFANWQYKKHFPDQEDWVLLKLKGTDSLVTCMKFYFKSEDTLYFREFPSQRIHKISKNDIQEMPVTYAKDYHFARRNQNLQRAALQPKILLGLSVASLAAVAIDLAQPAPYLVNAPVIATAPVFLLLGYAQAKKMDRYLNYYQMAEEQKFTKPELPKENMVASNKSQTISKDTTQITEFHQNTSDAIVVPSQQVPANTNNTSISDEYRYGTTEVPEIKTLITSSGCQYQLSDFYFESDGNYYFSIQGQAGNFYMNKDEVVRLSGVLDTGKDKKFANNRFVLEKARTGKVIGVLYGIGGTFVWGVAIGVATWSVGPALAGGAALGIGPAVLIVKKCNTTIRNYKIYNDALRVTCN